MLYRDGEGLYWLLYRDSGNKRAMMQAADEKGNKLGDILFSKNLEIMEKVA